MRNKIKEIYNNLVVKMIVNFVIAFGIGWLAVQF